MASPRWRVYYGDHSTFGSGDGSPHEAPRRGVIGIVQEVPGGQPDPKDIVGGEVYVWRGYGWTRADAMGLQDYLMFHDGPLAVLYGWTARDDLWNTIGARMGREGLG